MSAKFTQTTVYCAFWLGTLLLASTQAALGVTVHDVMEAWAKHDNNFRSLQCSVVISRTEEVVVDGPGDPFAPPEDKTLDFVDLKALLEFSLSGEKIAYIRTGEVLWDADKKMASTEPQLECFDGKKSTLLLHGEDRTVGYIDSVNIGNGLFKSVDIVPLWLGVSPTRFFKMRSASPFKEMSIASDRIQWDGRKCIDTIIPLDRGGSIHFYLDDVDFRVLRCAVLTANGILQRETKLEYSDNQAIGWVLKKFVVQHFDKEGQLTLKIQGDIPGWKIDEPIKNSTFEIVFPIGTYFRKDGLYFIQEAHGEAREVTDEEFSHPPVHVEPIAA